jgi:hypothetical protein
MAVRSVGVMGGMTGHDRSGRPISAPSVIEALSLLTVAVVVVTLNLSWATGCVPTWERRCGSHSAFRLLTWETAIPVAVTLLAAGAVAWWTLRPNSRRASVWALSSLFANGLTIGGFFVRGLGHPWISDFPGQQPAGWNYGVGLFLFGVSAILPFVSFGLGVWGAGDVSPEYVPRWWRFVSGSPRGSRWVG